MKTIRYRPLHTSGRHGPTFDTLSAAQYWIAASFGPEGWHVELIRYPVVKGPPPDLNWSNERPERYRAAPQYQDLSGCADTRL